MSSSPSAFTNSTNNGDGEKVPKIGIQWRKCCNINFLVKIFGVCNQTSLFSWTALLASLLHVLALGFCGGILLQVLTKTSLKLQSGDTL